MVDLQPTRCAICGTLNGATTVYAANFTDAAFNPTMFSARRLPDQIHCRIVRCCKCGLVRADPVAAPGDLAELYARSTFDYGAEVDNLRETYARYLAKLDPFGARKGTLLEIGCGNGFVLEAAREQGYTEVWGVEPSIAAVEQAIPALRHHIIRDVFYPGLFPPERFDVICTFQVFDHLPDPGAVLDECKVLLKPGGLLLLLNHNVAALSSRLLGERSPIIDIEHTYLYSPTTIRLIAEAHGFTVRATGSALNRYSLQYLLRLVPIPAAPKRMLLDHVAKRNIGRLRLSVPLGNLYLVAQKGHAP